MQVNYYKKILETNNPDKHLEYFWLNFKDAIFNVLDDDEKRDITMLSNKLNILQKDKKYDDIKDFIEEHFQKFGWRYMRRTFYNKDDTFINIKKWKKIYNKTILNKNYTKFDILFDIYISVYNKNNTKDYDKDILELIVSYQDKEDIDKEIILKKIILICVNNKQYGIIDKIKYIYNLNRLTNKPIKNILNMCGRKIAHNIKVN